METHATGEAVEGLEQAEFMGKERKRGGSPAGVQAGRSLA